MTDVETGCFSLIRLQADMPEAILISIVDKGDFS